MPTPGRAGAGQCNRAVAAQVTLKRGEKGTRRLVQLIQHQQTVDAVHDRRQIGGRKRLQHASRRVLYSCKKVTSAIMAGSSVSVS